MYVSVFQIPRPAWALSKVSVYRWHSETIDTVQEIRSICSCCSNVLVARYIVKLKYLAVISYLPWSSKVGYSSIDIKKLIPGDFSIPLARSMSWRWIGRIGNRHISTFLGSIVSFPGQNTCRHTCMKGETKHFKGTIQCQYPWPLRSGFWVLGSAFGNKPDLFHGFHLEAQNLGRSIVPRK